MANEERARVVQAARHEAERMRRSTEDAPDAGRITMSVEQFRALATLIDRVAAIAADVPGEGGRSRDGFADPIDGVRFWVPLPYLEAERARHSTQLALARGPTW